jgi:hypothetical protein
VPCCEGSREWSAILTCHQPSCFTSTMTPVSLRKHIGILKDIIKWISVITGAFVAIGLFFILLITACVPILPAMYFARKRPPTPQDRDIEAVSGLYGPGTYIAWVLCTLSAIIGSATEETPSRLSVDQITSIIYSACSMYWCQIHIQRQSDIPDVSQNYTIQAGLFVLNVSALLHGIGWILSSGPRKATWLLFLCWDIWILWLPMAMVNPVPISWIIHLVGVPMIVGIFSVINFNNPWKSAPFLLLPFAVFEAARCQFSTTWIFGIPKTTASLTDLDQFVSLVTATVLLIYQWKFWRLPIIDRILRANSSEPQ